MSKNIDDNEDGEDDDEFGNEEFKEGDINEDENVKEDESAV